MKNSQLICLILLFWNQGIVPQIQQILFVLVMNVTTMEQKPKTVNKN